MAPAKNVTSPPAVDLESLLAPISVERPSGEHLRYDAAYDAIEELRREDDPTLPQGVWKRELKKAEWDRVAARCLEILETRSKDLQVAAWLLEAWLHQHGFAGVEQGLRLLIGLCESFWETVHPQAEDGDPDYRLAPLRWIDQRISLAVQGIALTAPETNEAPPYSWLDWQGALRVANLERIDAAAAEEEAARGKTTQEKILVSVSLTSTAFYRRLEGDLERCRAATGQLASILSEAAGDAAPSFVKLREAIEAIARLVRSILDQRGPADDRETEAEEGAAAPIVAVEIPEEHDMDPMPIGRPIASRGEAYRMLSEAAAYLLRTEPHSPTPYLVKRAVAWGNLTLAELLKELMKDSADVATVYSLLGIKEIDRNES